MATTNSAVLTCRSCSAEVPSGARFCSECGAHLGDGETLELPADPVVADPRLNASQTELPPTLHQIHRRPLGVRPVPLLGGLAVAMTVLAIILLATGAVVGGIVLLVGGLTSLLLFSSAVRHEPDTPLARATLRAAGRVRSTARLFAVILRIGSRAGLELLRIRQRRQRLRSELQQHLGPLGQAVYEDDDARAATLKQQAAALERKLREAERQASAVRDGARLELARERATVEPTEQLVAESARGEPPRTSSLA